jgi:hypothetical protein
MTKSAPLHLRINRPKGTVPGRTRAISVSLPAGLVARLDTLARERGIARCALVRDFLILEAYR